MKPILMKDRMDNRIAVKHVRPVSLWVKAMSASPRGYRSDVLMEAPVNKRSPIRSIAVPDTLKAHQIVPRVAYTIKNLFCQPAMLPVYFLNLKQYTLNTLVVSGLWLVVSS